MTKKRVLFVCLGNICRSPAAEGIFSSMVSRRGLEDFFEVDSAGTYGGHSGEKADSRMRAAASEKGYNLTSRSRQVRSDDFDNFDIIVAMDDNNYERLFRLAPSVEASHKICRMATYVDDQNVDHIPDPYYEGADGFYYVIRLLEQGCENLLNELIDVK